MVQYAKANELPERFYKFGLFENKKAARIAPGPSPEVTQAVAPQSGPGSLSGSFSGGSRTLQKSRNKENAAGR